MSEHISEIQGADFERAVLAHPGIVALDFYSTECPPCEALAPKFDGAAALYGEDVKFLKIYRQGNRELAEKLGVRASPTVIFFRAGKEVGKRLTSGIKRSELARELDALLPAERVSVIRGRIRPIESETD